MTHPETEQYLVGCRVTAATSATLLYFAYRILYLNICGSFAIGVIHALKLLQYSLKYCRYLSTCSFILFDQKDGLLIVLYMLGIHMIPNVNEDSSMFQSSYNVFVNLVFFNNIRAL